MPETAVQEHDFGDVLVRATAPTVAEVVLNRVDSLNAVSTQFARDIAAAAHHLAGADRLACVVLRSATTKAFCVGADLKERAAFTDDDLRAQRPIARHAYGSILDLPMPVIAAVEGFALGGGYELALSCDVIVAGESAVVGLPETRVGVIPGGGGTQLLTRRVGYAKAAAAIFAARKFTVSEAFAAGMVDQVVPAGSAHEAAHDMAQQIAANSPVCLRQAKHALRTGFDLPLAAGLDVEDGAWRAAAFSADRREGVAAFAQKREPQWPGRL